MIQVGGSFKSASVSSNIFKALRQTSPWRQLARNPPSVPQCHPGRDGCLVPIAVPARWPGEDHANWALASKSDGNIGVWQPPPADQLHGWPCSNHQFEHIGPPRPTRCRSCQPPPLLYLSRCEGSSRVASCHRHSACRWHDRGPTKRKMPLASLYHGRRPASLQSLCKTYPQSTGPNVRNEQEWCTKDKDSLSETRMVTQSSYVPQLPNAVADGTCLNADIVTAILMHSTSCCGFQKLRS